ncbi:hypothetical protein [Bacillus velezensis]
MAAAFFQWLFPDTDDDAFSNFAFSGTELIGIAAGESADPEKNRSARH